MNPMELKHEGEVYDKLQNEYKLKKRDFLFKSSGIAKKMGISSYAVVTVLKRLEEENKVERTSFSRTITIWKTRFDKK